MVPVLESWSRCFSSGQERLCLTFTFEGNTNNVLFYSGFRESIAVKRIPTHRASAFHIDYPLGCHQAPGGKRLRAGDRPSGDRQR